MISTNTGRKHQSRLRYGKVDEASPHHIHSQRSKCNEEPTRSDVPWRNACVTNQEIDGACLVVEDVQYANMIVDILRQLIIEYIRSGNIDSSVNELDGDGRTGVHPHVTVY